MISAINQLKITSPQFSVLTKHDPRFRDHIKGSAVDNLYQWIRFVATEFERVEFDTPEGQLELRIPQSDAFRRYANKPGGHEPMLTSDLHRCLDASSTFFDIGSHFGYMLQVGLDAGSPPRSIHAFEWNSFRYRALKEFFGSQGVRVNHARIGSNSSSNDLRLDDYCTDGLIPDVVKIDIEGDELDALRGFSKTIEQHRPRLYVEVHPKLIESHGDNWRDVIDWLQRHDYTLTQAKQLSESQSWEPIDEDTDPDMPFHVRAAVD